MRGTLTIPRESCKRQYHPPPGPSEFRPNARLLPTAYFMEWKPNVPSSIKLLFLAAVLAIPALALAQSAAPASPAATQAQIAALQQAVTDARSAGRQRMDAGFGCPGFVDDRARPRSVLWRPVRKKNILATMMQSFAMMCLVTVLWAVVGYSLAFGHGSAFIAASSTSSCAAFRSPPTPTTPPPFRADLHGLPIDVPIITRR